MSQTPPQLLKRHAAKIAALAAITLLYGFARLPQLDEAERTALAAEFKFTRLALPGVRGPAHRYRRDVNPAVANIGSWISAVGAAATLADIDGDGLSNEQCYVETRTNQVIVAPVPGSSSRYLAHTLDAAPFVVDQTMAPMGCLAGDFDESGTIDLLVYYWGRTPILHLSDQRGKFIPALLTAKPARWFSNAVTLADLDGDGHLDLVITNYFADGAEVLDPAATSATQMQHSMSRAWNGGGTHFFLSTIQTATTHANEGAVPLFRPVLAQLPPNVSNSWTLGLAAADLDGDLLPELYFANDFGPDRLLHNRSSRGRLRFGLLEGERAFATVASKQLGRDSFKGMGVDFADLNRDGHLDIYVSNIAAEFALQESHFMFISTGEVAAMGSGHAPYRDQSERLGLSRSSWAWEARLADMNNDGRLEALQATGFIAGQVDRWPELQELALSNDELLSNPRFWPRLDASADLSGHSPNPFFVRAADGRFYDLAAAIGIGEAQVTRGIAIADVDGDGDLDFVTANQWQPSWFYRNECPNCSERSFLGLHLRHAGPTDFGSGLHCYIDHPRRPMSPAVGATVKVRLPGGHTTTAQVDGGNGHSGQGGPGLHFGLGRFDPEQTVPVELTWRDRTGTKRVNSLRLKPGWHTIVLGGPEETKNEC